MRKMLIFMVFTGVVVGSINGMEPQKDAAEKNVTDDNKRLELIRLAEAIREGCIKEFVRNRCLKSSSNKDMSVTELAAFNKRFYSFYDESGFGDSFAQMLAEELQEYETLCARELEK